MFHCLFNAHYSDILSTEVVHITRGIWFLWLIVVDNPVVIIDDILVVVLLRLLNMHDLEPLVGEWIKGQVVPHLPVVEGTTKLDPVVSWSSVRESECVTHLVERQLIESRHNVVDFSLI